MNFCDRVRELCRRVPEKMHVTKRIQVKERSSTVFLDADTSERSTTVHDRHTHNTRTRLTLRLESLSQYDEHNARQRCFFSLLLLSGIAMKFYFAPSSPPRAARTFPFSSVLRQFFARSRFNVLSLLNRRCAIRSIIDDPRHTVAIVRPPCSIRPPDRRERER